MRNASDKSSKENKNTHLIFSNFLKSCHWWGNVEKYSRVKQVTDDSMEHVLCLLDT